ncbi:unnamed protein product [Schistocephalus solidus]|uniref:Reverse transcriptase domain-containing protein n=1 Tax=Schistocephalus solidus TaxID=70667 RepID=A0A183TU13_SCHSO|nr:unnamed protein product [Schistocephalus solidus]
MNQLHEANVYRFKAANKAAFYRSFRIVQQRLREIQDAWMTRKAEKIQGAGQQLTSGKTPGSDAFPTEIYKFGRKCGTKGKSLRISKTKPLSTSTRRKGSANSATTTEESRSRISVSRDMLWKTMQKFGCSEHFMHMVYQFYDGMMACVTDNGTLSEAFAVTNRVKQGYFLAPCLFSLMLSAMLTDAYREECRGIHIAYRMDGGILNQR